MPGAHAGVVQRKVGGVEYAQHDETRDERISRRETCRDLLGTGASLADAGDMLTRPRESGDAFDRFGGKPVGWGGWAQR